MTKPTANSNLPQAPGKGTPGIGRLLLAAPPLALATVSLTGLGLLHGLPTGLALTVAITLAFLPTLGLGAIGPQAPAKLRAWSAWVWCLLVLLALPLYFPGERGPATREGTRHLIGWLGTSRAEALAGALEGAVGILGRDPRPLNPSIANTSTEGPKTTPLQPVPSPAPALTRSENEADGSVRIPYLGDKNSLRIEADIDGPEIGERFTLLFDTGATFTTLNRASLDAIGLSIPPDAPRVTLQTANGRLETELVLVDAVWLGDSPVEWVTIAVCDSCVSPPAVGLLGLNVSQRFQVSLDHNRREISLERRTIGDDRSLDIRNWLQIRSRATAHWDGRIEVELKGFNDSRREIRSAVIGLECSGEGFAIQLDAIPPFGEAAVQVELPRDTDCSQQELELTRAYWGLGRFE